MLQYPYILKMTIIHPCHIYLEIAVEKREGAGKVTKRNEYKKRIIYQNSSQLIKCCFLFVNLSSQYK